MTSSRAPSASQRLHQSPPPPLPGSGASPYTRFIPREELKGFAAWRPGAFAEPPAFVQPAQPGSPNASAHVGGQPKAAAAATGPAWPSADFKGAADSPGVAPANPGAAGHEALRAEWQADLQAQVAAARQQGYQDGYRDGLVALDSFKQSFASQTSTQVAQVLKSFDDELNQLEQQMALSVARVATELARQVVRSELGSRPALIAQVAQEAVNAVLMSARHITVQLHPDDHALVAQGCEEALSARGARLLSQAAIARGGCRVESDVGVIDARIATRWLQATQSLGSGIVWDDQAEHPSEPGGDA